MKVLYLEWKCFGNEYIKRALKKLNIDIVNYDFPRTTLNTRNSEELANSVALKILEEDVDFVFSFNYFPVVAIAANACRRKYISWTYDSPYIQLYSKTIELDTNYAFVFDSAEVINLQRKNVNTVYYLPMAADTEYYDGIVVSQSEKKVYDADIAMIGSMYTEEHNNLFRHLSDMDDYTRGYIDGLMNMQKNIYGMSILEKGLTNDVVKKIQEVCPVRQNGDGIEDVEWVIANYFIARHLTGVERTAYIDALSKKYMVTLYTPEETPNLLRVKNMGTVEYFKDSPKAIKCAKINLNISLRSIVNGIPLRCFDIMGAGGFLLTNYQADFEGIFESDKDYVYFEDTCDLMDKAGYYLEHEEERLKIAASGYQKVKNYHSFVTKLQHMLNIAGLL